MSGHTPGPWGITYGGSDHEPRKPNKPFYVIGPMPHRNRSTKILAHVPGWDTEYAGMGPANARLIAAAPDLLEACKWFMAQLDSSVFVRDTSKDGDADWHIRSMRLVVDLGKAATAITKAEGNAREARRHTENDGGVQSQTGAAHADRVGCPSASGGAD